MRSGFLDKRLSCIAIVIFAMGINVAAGQEACQGNCQGRCRFGVDGICTPKRVTFGHYQSSWRRWPEPPPAVSACQLPSSAVGGSGPGLELPGAVDEHRTDAEFQHLRKNVSNIPAYSGDADSGQPNRDATFNGEDSLEMQRPDNGFVPLDEPPALDLDIPAANEEAENTRNLLQFRTRAYQARMTPARPNSNAKVSRVAYHTSKTANPLRNSVATQLKPKAALELPKNDPNAKSQHRIRASWNPLR